MTALVECELTEVPDGTRLRIVESGFDKRPPGASTEAFRMTLNGWVSQAQRIAKYLASTR